MKHTLLLCALFLSLFSFAQQDTLHVVTRYKNGMINEDYIVNKSGDKNGSYTRMTRFGKKYITGQYKEGVPYGVWNYYASDTTGELVQKLDFDTHKELFVDPLRVHSLICGPRFFGGSMVEQEFLQHRIKTDFTEEERNKYKNFKYTVSFTVDSLTLLPMMITCNENDVPLEIKARLEKIVADMPTWLPPVCKDEKVWRFSVTFVF